MYFQFPQFRPRPSSDHRVESSMARSSRSLRRAAYGGRPRRRRELRRGQMAVLYLSSPGLQPCLTTPDAAAASASDGEGVSGNWVWIPVVGLGCVGLDPGHLLASPNQFRRNSTMESWVVIILVLLAQTLLYFFS